MALLDYLNAARTSVGVAPLRADDRLDTAARLHAQDIATHPGLLHDGSDGSTIGQRIAASGYQAEHWGEVVGWGFGGDARQMVEWWLVSPDHRGYVLSADFADVGVGYVVAPGTPWGHYWCVDFAGGAFSARPPRRPRPERPVAAHRRR